jgi:orotidine-5'-phosphate decarboxylase
MKENQNRRPIVLPIDGTKGRQDLIDQLERFLTYEDILSWLGMIKVNDAVHIPFQGPDILSDIRSRLPKEVGLFLDLKIGDVSATVRNTLGRYVDYKPDIVTVSSIVTANGLLAIRETLPMTEIALVDILTDMKFAECNLRYGKAPSEKIASTIVGFDTMCDLMGLSSPIDVVVCSGYDLPHLKSEFGSRFKFLCPGIRDSWMLEGGNKDHQERVGGVYDALSAGADYLVMGAQLTKGNPRADISPEESRQLTITELKRYFEGGV